MGWQIDNEIYFQGCTCSHCEEGFREHLRKKYGTVENLNKAWNLTLWSQEYSDFDEIGIPVNAWHNPHIKLEYHLFQSDTHSNYIGMQADILKKYTKAPIGTGCGFHHQKVTGHTGQLIQHGRKILALRIKTVE